jgi:hypothetical protein
MSLIIRCNLRHIHVHGLPYYVTDFYNKFVNKIQEKHSNINFEILRDETYASCGNVGTDSCLSLSIIHPETKKYIVVSHHDVFKNHFCKHLGWDPENMVKFFHSASFNFVDYFNYRAVTIHNPDIFMPLNIKDIYEPFYYCPYFELDKAKREEIYNSRSNKKLNDLLMFRGYMWDWRKQMTQDLPTDRFKIIDKNVDDQNLNFIEYLEDLSNYNACLSLPGGSNLCNRDLEAFSIGVPVVRCFVDKHYDDPLIPDYHYLCCYYTARYWDWSCQIHADAFRESLNDLWYRIRYNDDLFRFISENCYEWFQRNCSSSDKIIEDLINRIDLKLLENE